MGPLDHQLHALQAVSYTVAHVSKHAPLDSNGLQHALVLRLEERPTQTVRSMGLLVFQPHAQAVNYTLDRVTQTSVQVDGNEQPSVLAKKSSKIFYSLTSS